jgi:hypothetical protein
MRRWNMLWLSLLAVGFTVGATRWADPGTVEGSVRNLEGNPIEGARVRGPSQLEAITNADGVYRLDNVGAGEVSVTAGAAGYRPTTITIRVVDDSATMANFVLRPDSLPTILVPRPSQAPSSRPDRP